MTHDPEPITPAEAAAVLAGVEEATAAVRHHGGWASRVFGTYAVATLAFFPASGLLHGGWSVAVSVGWAVFLLGLLGYVAPRRVISRGVRRLYRRTTLGWAALWLVGAVLGHVAFADRPAFWLPAALVVAAPMAVATRVSSRPAIRAVHGAEGPPAAGNDPGERGRRDRERR